MKATLGSVGRFGQAHSLIINDASYGVNNTFGASVKLPLYETFYNGSDYDGLSHLTGSRSMAIR